MKNTMSNAGRQLMAVLVVALIGVGSAFAAPEEMSTDNEVAQPLLSIFQLDESFLINAFDASGISAYQCKSALKEFKKTIAEANLAATSHREKVSEVVKLHLRDCLAKAQEAGNLDKVVALKQVLESENSELVGNLEEIAKLREGRRNRLSKIDQGLATTGLNAARTLNGVLEWQKKETTRKGDIEEAKRIATFQNEVKNWAKVTIDSFQREYSQRNAMSQSQPVLMANDPDSSGPLESLSEDSQKQVAKPQFGSPVKLVKPEDLRLTGTQKEMSRTLDYRQAPYIISGCYIIPKGAEMDVAEGVKLVFEKGASMTVEGRLLINGTLANPVVLKGKTSGRSAWMGIKFFGDGGSIIDYAHISGAEEAIHLSESVVRISNTTLYRNTRAIQLTNSRAKPSPIENCMICDNEDGIHFSFSTVVLENSTVTGNAREGLVGDYYGDTRCERCVITKNGKGIDDGGYSANIRARNCIIEGNDEYNVSCRSTNAGDFRENYWGRNATTRLIQRGDGIQLPGIKGNRVDIADFLREPPSPCGAKDYPPLNTK